MGCEWEGWIKSDKNVRMKKGDIMGEVVRAFVMKCKRFEVSG